MGALGVAVVANQGFALIKFFSQPTNVYHSPTAKRDCGRCKGLWETHGCSETARIKANKAEQADGGSHRTRPLDIRFAEFDTFRALRAPGSGCPFLRAASGPRSQLLGAARPGRAAQQHSALGPIWAFLGHTSPRGVVAGTFLDTELIGSIAVADRAGLGRRRRNRSRQTRRDGPIADLLH